MKVFCSEYQVRHIQVLKDTFRSLRLKILYYTNLKNDSFSYELTDEHSFFPVLHFLSDFQLKMNVQSKDFQDVPVGKFAVFHPFPELFCVIFLEVFERHRSSRSLQFHLEKERLQTLVLMLVS